MKVGRLGLPDHGIGAARVIEMMRGRKIHAAADVDNAGTPGVPQVTLTYGYDANGNLVTTQDSLGGTTSYSYDALDRLASVQQFGTNVQPKRVDMNYDKASLLQSMSRFADLGG